MTSNSEARGGDKVPSPRTPPHRPPANSPITPEAMGTWGDPTDIADREAFERARREQELERPPHY